MPEGDTIYRTATRLCAVLDGQPVLSATAGEVPWDPAPLVGCCVSAVEARGKHLLIHFGDGPILHSHMGMTGSWHIYRPEQTWHKPASRAALILHTGSVACACFYPKILELLTIAAFRNHQHLAKLGPDLLTEQFDEEVALKRFRSGNRLPIGEAIMNQTIVCGVGNIYKSEVLFLERLNPFQRTDQLLDREILQLMRVTRQLMRRNRTGFPRRTRFGRDGQRLWVYGRSGHPCLECGGSIQMRRQGMLGRTTYWCADCQPLR